MPGAKVWPGVRSGSGSQPAPISRSSAALAISAFLSQLMLSAANRSRAALLSRAPRRTSPAKLSTPRCEPLVCHGAPVQQAALARAGAAIAEWAFGACFVNRTRRRGGPDAKGLIEGGFIRKLWDGETDAYRDHLLRLDPESRRNRFSGSVADETIRSFAATARGPDVVVHGFFVDGVLRGAADLHIVRPLDLRLAEAALSIERPWQSHRVGSALLNAPCFPRATGA